MRALNRFRDVAGDEITRAAFLDYNREFHAAVAHLAGNTRLAAVENSLVEEFDRLVLVSLQAHSVRWIPRAVTEHKMIIEAIQAHDSDTAFQLVHDHILSARERYIADPAMLESKQGTPSHRLPHWHD